MTFKYRSSSLKLFERVECHGDYRHIKFERCRPNSGHENSDDEGLFLVLFCFSQPTRRRNVVTYKTYDGLLCKYIQESWMREVCARSLATCETRGHDSPSDSVVRRGKNSFMIRDFIVALHWVPMPTDWIAGLSLMVDRGLSVTERLPWTSRHRLCGPFLGIFIRWSYQGNRDRNRGWNVGLRSKTEKK